MRLERSTKYLDEEVQHKLSTVDESRLMSRLSDVDDQV